MTQTEPRTRHAELPPSRGRARTDATTRTGRRRDRVDEVLIQQHREIARALDLASAPGPDPASDDRQGLMQRLAAHHAIEEAVVRPVIVEVLEEPSLVARRHSDVLVILECLAGAEGLEGDARTEGVRQARDVFVDHAESTELRLLIYLHRILAEEDRRELGERHVELVGELQAAVPHRTEVTVLYEELLGLACGFLPVAGGPRQGG